MTTKDLHARKTREIAAAREVANDPSYDGTGPLEVSYQRHVEEAQRFSRLENEQRERDELDAETGDARSALGSVIFPGAGRPTMTAMDSTLNAEMRDALDPKSPVTEFSIVPPNRQFRANELYTGDSAVTYSSYLFQNQMYPQIIKHLNAASAVLEAGATVITTDHLRPIDIPVLLTDATAGQTAELSPATQTYPVFDKVTLGAYRQDGFTVFSEEMRLASEYDLQGLLADAAGRALATQVAKLLATGAGTITPAGIDLAASGHTTTSKTMATSDDVIATLLSLDRPYQKQASFIVSSGMYQQMLSWINDDGSYLMRTVDGMAGSFMGRPLYVEPELADPAAGTVPLVVGDISRMFVRMSQINFEVDKSSYFKEFCLVVRFAVWMDSSPLVDVKALRTMTMLA